MSHPPTPRRGSRPGDAERDLNLLFGEVDGRGPTGPGPPARVAPQPGDVPADWVGEMPGDPSEEAARRLNRLGMAVRILGTASIGLGIVSAVFIWPRVRIIWLSACTLTAIALALAGLGLRAWHRGHLRRLAGDLRAHHQLYRTRANRSRAGLALGVLMLAAGLAILQVEPRPDAAARPAPPADAESQASRSAVIRPGQTYRDGDLSVRVASAAVRRPDDGPAVLEVVLEARNVSSTRKLTMDQFRDVEGPLSRGTLHDDLANNYDGLERPAVVSGHEASNPSALYPGERVLVRLVFERPVPGARSLRLLLPTGSFDLPRSIVFEFDTAKLAEDAPAPPDAGG